AIEVPKQEAWAANPHRILDVALLARLVAQGGIALGTAETDAGRDGYSPDKLDALVYLEQTVPGFAQALDLWRRDRISDALFEHTLVKAGMDQRYIDQLMAYKTNELIPPPDLAYMVVRDLVPDPFPGEGPSGPNDNTISDIPVLPIDTLTEAARSGWDATRFEALVGRSGLAPAAVAAGEAYFRGIASYDQFLTMIKKGDLRPAYANVILNTARQILTADQAMEGVLRGWWDKQTGYDLAADHGMSNANAERIYQIRRRPMTV